LYIYIYIYMCIYIYIYIYICIYMYMRNGYMYIPCAHSHTHTHTQIIGNQSKIILDNCTLHLTQYGMESLFMSSTRPFEFTTLSSCTYVNSSLDDVIHTLSLTLSHSHTHMHVHIHARARTHTYLLHVRHVPMATPLRTM